MSITGKHSRPSKDCCKCGRSAASCHMCSSIAIVSEAACTEQEVSKPARHCGRYSGNDSRMTFALAYMTTVVFTLAEFLATTVMIHPA